MDTPLRVTPESVAATRRWVLERDEHVVSIINRVRDDLGAAFAVTVDSVDTPAYREEIAAVFDDGDRAANITGLVAILRELDVVEDYPGFIVDEVVGRELAATIAGEQPLRLLAEATFHYADATHHPTDDGAGLDDLDAALAAGVQTRLPGWDWRQAAGPFDDRTG